MVSQKILGDFLVFQIHVEWNPDEISILDRVGEGAAGIVVEETNRWRQSELYQEFVKMFRNPAAYGIADRKVGYIIYSMSRPGKRYKQPIRKKQKRGGKEWSQPVLTRTGWMKSLILQETRTGIPDWGKLETMIHGRGMRTFGTKTGAALGMGGAEMGGRGFFDSQRYNFSFGYPQTLQRAPYLRYIISGRKSYKPMQARNFVKAVARDPEVRQKYIEWMNRQMRMRIGGLKEPVGRMVMTGRSASPAPRTGV